MHFVCQDQNNSICGRKSYDVIGVGIMSKLNETLKGSSLCLTRQICETCWMWGGITHLMWWHMRYCHVVTHVVVVVKVWK